MYLLSGKITITAWPCASDTKGHCYRVTVIDDQNIYINALLFCVHLNHQWHSDTWNLGNTIELRSHSLLPGTRLRSA